MNLFNWDFSFWLQWFCILSKEAREFWINCMITTVLTPYRCIKKISTSTHRRMTPSHDTQTNPWIFHPPGLFLPWINDRKLPFPTRNWSQRKLHPPRVIKFSGLENTGTSTSSSRSGWCRGGGCYTRTTS